MSDDISDYALEASYRPQSTVQLKRAAVSFALDRADAYLGGPEREAFLERRLALIRRLLEERGETSPADNLFGDPE
jgi:hypothetical protein